MPGRHLALIVASGTLCWILLGMVVIVIRDSPRSSVTAPCDVVGGPPERPPLGTQAGQEGSLSPEQRDTLEAVRAVGAFPAEPMHADVRSTEPKLAPPLSSLTDERSKRVWARLPMPFRSRVDRLAPEAQARFTYQADLILQDAHDANLRFWEANGDGRTTTAEFLRNAAADDSGKIAKQKLDALLKEMGQ